MEKFKSYIRKIVSDFLNVKEIDIVELNYVNCFGYSDNLIQEITEVIENQKAVSLASISLGNEKNEFNEILIYDIKLSNQTKMIVLIRDTEDIDILPHIIKTILYT